MTDTKDTMRRRSAVSGYRKKLLQHKKLKSRVRSRSKRGELVDAI
ncbi:unnamed protein product [Lathyrus oleraceus]